MSRWIFIGACVWMVVLGGAGLFMVTGWEGRSAVASTAVATATQTNVAESQSQVRQTQATQQAYPGWLNIPVGCTIGRDCWVLQQFDHDPGPDFRDYACGARAYNAHKGVDFGLATDSDMRRNLPVLAAAAGRVLRLRDGEPDGIAVTQGVDAVSKGRECGNAVILEHGGGWETIYCHMRRGSVAVKQGQTVAAGQQLGAVGMSGKAEFAHLHLGVRYKNNPYDPFLPGGLKPGACKSIDALWTPAAAAALQYSPLDMVAVGISDTRPNVAGVNNGQFNSFTRRDADALFGWVLAWNTKAGDILRVDIQDPSGKALLSTTQKLDRGYRRHFRFAGTKKSGAWRSGNYTVTATIQRSGRTPITRQMSRTVKLR